jgi:hypothetical protein
MKAMPDEVFMAPEPPKDEEQEIQTKAGEFYALYFFDRFLIFVFRCRRRCLGEGEAKGKEGWNAI